MPQRPLDHRTTLERTAIGLLPSAYLILKNGSQIESRCQNHVSKGQSGRECLQNQTHQQRTQRSDKAQRNRNIKQRKDQIVKVPHNQIWHTLHKNEKRQRNNQTLQICTRLNQDQQNRNKWHGRQEGGSICNPPSTSLAGPTLLVISTRGRFQDWTSESNETDDWNQTDLKGSMNGKTHAEHDNDLPI